MQLPRIRIQEQRARAWARPVSTPDALVVGGGPAGSIAALVLARAGYRVRLIERERFPRHKLCGDTVNPGAMALLTAVAGGAPFDVAARVRSSALPVAGMVVTGPNGATVRGDYPPGIRGAALLRRDLDLLLVEAATAAGVVLDEGVAARAPLLSPTGRVIGVRVSSGHVESDLRAGIVIAADGRASRLAAALRLSAFASRKRWAYGAYFTDVAGMTNRGEMHVRSGGYVGLAPLPGGVTNVCVVAQRDACTGGRVNIARTVLDAVQAEPVLRERFAGARQVSSVSILGPLAVNASAAGAPGLLLAGDAAGFVDPMTGDGLRFALSGAVLAAAAAQDELTSGRPAFHWLQAARRDAFAAKWRVNRMLRLLVGSPRAVAFAAAVTAKWSAPLRHLIGVAGDVGLATGPGARHLVDYPCMWDGITPPLRRRHYSSR